MWACLEEPSVGAVCTQKAGKPGDVNPVSHALQMGSAD